MEEGDFEMNDNNEDMRLVLGKAAEVVLTYGLSDEFNWDRDRDILLDITVAANKLKAILDAREDRVETGPPSPMVQD